MRDGAFQGYTHQLHSDEAQRIRGTPGRDRRNPTTLQSDDVQMENRVFLARCCS